MLKRKPQTSFFIFQSSREKQNRSARFTIEVHPDPGLLLSSESFRASAFEAAAKIRPAETETDSNRISADEVRNFVVVVVVVEAAVDDGAAKKSTEPTLEERKAASEPTTLAKAAAKMLLVRCQNSFRPSF